MLNDSFPVHRRAEWEPLVQEPDHSQRRRKLEAWLDRGPGECWLHRSEIAALVKDTLCDKDGADYRLCAWVLMPNHVHLVVDVWDKPLVVLLNTWKGRTSRAANQFLRRSGSFWQPGYFDTLIRDEAHQRRAVHYVEANPVKAGLTKEPADWPWSSAHRQ